jgi:hypothetical protein
MQNKFETIQSWIPGILSAIKHDIKTDHLPGSPQFVKTHFGNRPLSRVNMDEIYKAYEKDLLSGDKELEEWVINHWVFKHGDIYTHFADRLSQVSEDFGSIEKLTHEESNKILEGAVERFGALPCYLFSVLNGVVFPEAVLTGLRDLAEKEEAEKKAGEVGKAKEQSVESYVQEIARLHKKHEERLSGVMKKYVTEVEALKKQIRSLQKQLLSK